MCAMNNEPIDNMLTKKSMKPMMQHMNLFIDTELNRNQPNIHIDKEIFVHLCIDMNKPMLNLNVNLNMLNQRFNRNEGNIVLNRNIVNQLLNMNKPK